MEHIEKYSIVLVKLSNYIVSLRVREKPYLILQLVCKNVCGAVA